MLFLWFIFFGIGIIFVVVGCLLMIGLGWFGGVVIMCWGGGDCCWIGWFNDGVGCILFVLVIDDLGIVGVVLEEGCVDCVVFIGLEVVVGWCWIILNCNCGVLLFVNLLNSWLILLWYFLCI